jgi:hypothetical protein
MILEAPGITRFGIVAATCLSLTLATGHGRLMAQSARDSVLTPHGWCRVWATVPGTGDPARDAAYNRCALDTPPSLQPGQRMPPPPWGGRYGRGTFTVVVSADGTVDPRLTRPWSLGGTDTGFHDRLQETLQSWRFEPGRLHGEAVRSGFRLYVGTGTRNDTVPSDLEWRYIRGTDADSLIGTWIERPSRLPLSQARQDSVFSAVLRTLRDRGAIVPDYSRLYCLVHPGADEAEHERLSRLAETVIFTDHRRPYMGLLPYGCEQRPGRLRIVVPAGHATENDRVVVFPSGDFLASWPAGFEGLPYHAWGGRCVVDAPSGAPARAECSVQPTALPEERRRADEQREARLAWMRRPPSRLPSTAESISVTVLVRIRDSFRVDTMRRVVSPLPRVATGAVYEPAPPCGGLGASTPEIGSEITVFVVDPTTRLVSMFQARERVPPAVDAPPPVCGSQELRRTEFIAFLLGDIGDPAQQPVTLCFSSINECALRYTLDPARHTIAEQAVLRFRISELQPAARQGDQLDLRIIVDPPLDDLIPLLVFADRRRAAIMSRVAHNAWDFTVTRLTPGLTPDDEILLYLFAR